MTKNIVFVVSFIISAVLFLLNYFGTYKICNSQLECTQSLADYMRVFSIILPFFLFSLITYKMREEVFRSWFRFARVYIPASMLLILLAPSYSSNWMFPYDKGRAAFLFSSLFIIISTVKIVLAYRRLRKNI